ncbi:hypothetical protein ACFPRL_05955 [Pseudoclavibacter helvolus]
MVRVLVDVDGNANGLLRSSVRGESAQIVADWQVFERGHPASLRRGAAPDSASRHQSSGSARRWPAWTVPFSRALS